ncbi:hypothetical protein ACNKHN_20720 [Shigella flexneri]
MCTASSKKACRVFLKGQGQGWITGQRPVCCRVLPIPVTRAKRRKVSRVEQCTMEIQRPIARALRAAVDLKALVSSPLRCGLRRASGDGRTRTASLRVPARRWQMRYRKWWKTAS